VVGLVPGILAGQLQRQRALAAARRRVAQARLGLLHAPREPRAHAAQPALELVATVQRQPFQQLAGLGQPARGAQRGCAGLHRQLQQVHVGGDRGVQGHGLAVHAQRLRPGSLGHGAPQVGQHLAQVGQRRGGRQPRPEHGRQPRARMRPPLHGQVGQQGPTLAVLQLDRMRPGPEPAPSQQADARLDAGRQAGG